MSKNAGKSEMKQSNAILQQNIARLEALNIPTIEAQKIALQSPELIGQLEAESLGPSATEQIEMDPRLRGSALASLSGIEELAQQGLGVEDRAAFDELSRRAAAQARAQQATILQGMSERGTLDSGAALAAQLQSGQAAADTLSQEGSRQAAAAAQARRAALGQQADMASSLQGQQLNLAGQKATAQDAISQFNAQNRQNVSAQNLASKQNIENARAAARNQEEISNKGLIGQKFQQEFQKAGGVSQSGQAQASNLQAQAGAAQQAQQAQTTGLLQLGGTLGSASLAKK